MENMARPNRLENVWEPLADSILHKWDKVKRSDLEECKYRFDSVVETIRKAYALGRSHITIEAEIKDWMIDTICKFEKRGLHEQTDQQPTQL